MVVGRVSSLCSKASFCLVGLGRAEQWAGSASLSSLKGHQWLCCGVGGWWVPPCPCVLVTRVTVGAFMNKRGVWEGRIGVTLGGFGVFKSTSDCPLLRWFLMGPVGWSYSVPLVTLKGTPDSLFSPSVV